MKIFKRKSNYQLHLEMIENYKKKRGIEMNKNEEWELEKKNYEHTITMLKEANMILQKSNDDYEFRMAFESYKKRYGRISKDDFKEIYGTLIRCSVCNEYFKEQDMTNHKWDVQGDEDAICISCREDE